MIKALNHTGFVVRDRDAAVAFYRDVVGLNLISEYGRRGPGVDQVVGYQGTELRSAVLDLGGGHILELIQYLSPAPAERPSEERERAGSGPPRLRGGGYRGDLPAPAAGRRQGDEPAGRAGAPAASAATCRTRTATGWSCCSWGEGLKSRDRQFRRTVPDQSLLL